MMSTLGRTDLYVEDYSTLSQLHSLYGPSLTLRCLALHVVSFVITHVIGP